LRYNHFTKHLAFSSYRMLYILLRPINLVPWESCDKFEIWGFHPFFVVIKVFRFWTTTKHEHLWLRRISAWEILNKTSESCYSCSRSYHN
jgi:hypothetical protein